MLIVYSPRAQRDLEAVYAYVARTDPVRAYGVRVALARAINRLADFPELGRRSSVAGKRELVVPRLPYIVEYRVQDERIRILRVRHTAQQR